MHPVALIVLWALAICGFLAFLGLHLHVLHS